MGEYSGTTRPNHPMPYDHHNTPHWVQHIGHRGMFDDCPMKSFGVMPGFGLRGVGIGIGIGATSLLTRGSTRTRAPRAVRVKKAKSSQVKFLLSTQIMTQIQNSPPLVGPLVPGAGSLRRRQNLNHPLVQGSSRRRRNCALLARVVRAAGMKRRRRISSFSFCICLSKESTKNKCRASVHSCLGGGNPSDIYLWWILWISICRMRRS